MPFFSVVIPTYNRQDFVIETIRGFLSQTFSDFEIIVVDDGSTDNTDVAINQIRDSRIIYRKKENGERGAARNYGARLARGKYINFFDSDDIAYPSHLQVAYDFIASNKNPEIFHLNYDIKLPDGTKIGEGTVPTKNFEKQIMHNNFLSCNNVFIRADICRQFPFEENRKMAVTEDWALWITLSARYHIHLLPKITSAIIMHDQRSIKDWNAEKVAEREELLISYVKNDAIVMKKFKPYIKKFIADRHTFVALLYAVKKNKKKSAYYLKTALFVTPLIFFSKRFLATLKKIVF